MKNTQRAHVSAEALYRADSSGRFCFGLILSPGQPLYRRHVQRLDPRVSSTKQRANKVLCFQASSVPIVNGYSSSFSHLVQPRVTQSYPPTPHSHTISNDSSSLTYTDFRSSYSEASSHTSILPPTSVSPSAPASQSPPTNPSNDEDNQDHPVPGANEEQSTSQKKSYNRNPKGNNQFRHCTRKDDENLRKFLIEYNEAGIVNKKEISRLLKEDHGMTISPAGVTRRRKDFGLNNARRAKNQSDITSTSQHRRINQKVSATALEKNSSARDVRDAQWRLHLLDFLAKYSFYVQDPSRIQKDIKFTSGIRLPLKWIRNELSSEWLVGGDAGSIHWGWRIYFEETNLGGILGICDLGSESWLGIWVLPCTSARSVLYCILTLARSFRGVPKYLAAGCLGCYGQLHDFLRETDRSRADRDSLPNRLVESFGDWVNRGLCNGRLRGGFYNEQFDIVIQEVKDQELKCPQNDPAGLLRKWTWSRWTQSKLDALRSKLNAIPCRGYDSVEKKMVFLPKEKWLTDYKKYGHGRDFREVDPSRVEQIMEDLGGEELIRFAPPEFRAKAEPIYDEIMREHRPQTLQELYNLMVPRMRPLEDGHGGED